MVIEEITYMKVKLMFITALVQISAFVSAQTIDMSQLGLKADGSQNAIGYLEKAVKMAAGYEKPVIVFPKGTYYFTPEFKGISDKKYTANIIRSVDNLTIDGGGSEFIFHGKTGCFFITDCKNFTIRNFSIDWDRPMISQAEFVEVSDNAVRVKIDKKQYPYYIEDGVVWYYGESWKSKTCKYNQIFDKKTRDIIPMTHDDSAGNFHEGKATEISEGVIEFAGPFEWKRKPEVGNIVTMYHYIYPADAFKIDMCTNVLVKDVTIHHGGSMMVMGTAVDGIHIDNVDAQARLSKDRYFANMADGFHLKGCKGKILIENCDYSGSGDDFVNVHNMYSPVEKVLSDKKLEVASFKGFVYAPGDRVWFVSKSTGQRMAGNTVVSVKNLKGIPWSGLYEMEFSEPVPAGLQQGDCIESAEWVPEVEICNNRVYKRHRATGVRVTTPKKAMIHNNYFNTAGHALMIEGDLIFWKESGANEFLEIRDNVFDNCMTSGSVTGGRWEWGEAVIDITPSHIPETKESASYHNNIIIAGNEFRVFDYPILRARSVNNLQFIGNKVIRTYDYEPYTVVKTNFLLEGCRNVLIDRNQFDGNLLGRSVSTYMMKKSDLRITKGQGLSVKNDGKKYVKQLEW